MKGMARGKEGGKQKQEAQVWKREGARDKLQRPQFCLLSSLVLQAPLLELVQQLRSDLPKFPET